MTRSAVVILLITGLFFPLTAAGSNKSPLEVALRFVPQESVETTSPDLLPAVLQQTVSVRVEDERGGDAAIIGKGSNDDDESFPIRTGAPLVPYLSSTLDAVAEQWGVRRAETADRILTLRLKRFFVDESNKAVGSVYAAEVKFAWQLASPSGALLAEGAASGSAHRYGRARSVDNCNEVLSDALKEGFANVLSTEALQQAWASGQPTGTVAPAPASAEERLRKLDELLRKGLITKDEYDRKRAEILKEL